MSDEPTLFTCDVCGTQFPADPECMIEAGWSIEHEGEAWKHADHHPVLSPDDRERAKAEMSIDDEQLDRLLRGEEIATGRCICRPCQDKDLAEQEEAI